MRILLTASFATEPFNELVRNGTAGAKIRKILEQTRPEAVYFTDMDGLRTALLVLDLKDASEIPALAEPWFLSFQAEVKFQILMTPDDLAKSGLDGIGKAWA
jgi:hypothetical protein